jgi:ribosomal-protein-alanine N-acetyltransferase
MINPTSAFPILHTPRLLLRELRPADLDPFYRLRSDPAVTLPYYAEPKTREQAETKLAALMRDNAINESLTWCIAQTGAPDALIGTICLWNFRGSTAEIGYDLLPAYHRQGIMREAAARVIEYGFGELSLSLIDAEVNPRNEPSCRLLEKLGFQKGETSIEQQNEGVMREFLKYTLER